MRASATQAVRRWLAQQQSTLFFSVSSSSSTQRRDRKNSAVDADPLMNGGSKRGVTSSLKEEEEESSVCLRNERRGEKRENKKDAPEPLELSMNLVECLRGHRIPQSRQEGENLFHLLDRLCDYFCKLVDEEREEKEDEEEEEDERGRRLRELSPCVSPPSLTNTPTPNARQKPSLSSPSPSSLFSSSLNPTEDYVCPCTVYEREEEEEEGRRRTRSQWSYLGPSREALKKFFKSQTSRVKGHIALACLSQSQDVEGDLLIHWLKAGESHPPPAFLFSSS
ncbi:hypothetical protein CSUI_002464 [Cystoisospora suis]|uniref:Uncharacterized protein n=1 Tax=Cystoisospora suis TaxID=483139 RepID=A0A2C6L8Q0_9APIC|nr:hypothetical protein CSUI_002464 [Cystoisospora suis]